MKAKMDLSRSELALCASLARGVMWMGVGLVGWIGASALPFALGIVNDAWVPGILASAAVGLVGLIPAASFGHLGLL